MSFSHGPQPQFCWPILSVLPKLDEATVLESKHVSTMLQEMAENFFGFGRSSKFSPLV